jgi:curli biogenesis system outer membrane secretion channel CsgG
MIRHLPVAALAFAAAVAHAQATTEAPAVAAGQGLPGATTSAASPVIGVLKFQDETGALFMQGGIGRVLTTMLTNELSARPAFTVVERQKLRAVLEEQDLSQSGRVSAETSIAIGKLTGAQYLVTGTVTSFEEKVELSTRRGWLGGTKVTGVSEGGYLAVDLRVIDTTTGEIAYARTVEGMTPPAAPGEVRTADPLTQGPDQRAVRAAVIEIVDYLQCAMVVRDACVAEYAAKDAARQERTRDSIRIK